MEYCFLKGFLVVLLIQCCTSEGLSAAILSSSVVTLQAGQAVPHEQELPHADVVPIVAPPNLKEVHQAMQEASEKVEDHGAEEVLKELLEKVVEAAMGEVEREGEAKGDEVTEDVLGAVKEEADTKAEVLEEKQVEDEDMGVKGKDTVVGKEQVVAEVDAFRDLVEEGKIVHKADTATGPMDETTEARDKDRVEDINVSMDSDVSQGIVDEMIGAIEETEEDLKVQEGEVKDSNEKAVLLKEKGAAETETPEATLTVVKGTLGGESEQESDLIDVGAGVEQKGDEQRKGEALVEESQVDEREGVVIKHSDNYETEPMHFVDVQEEEEVNHVNRAGGPEGENQQGYILEEGGVAELVEVEATNLGKSAGAEGHGESGKLINEAGEEERFASETSETDNQEVAVISAPGPEDGAEASIEQSRENQSPTLSPPLGGVEAEEKSLSDNISNRGNEIITPTDDLLLHNPVVVQPTLDNFVKDVQAERPQAGSGEPGETNELVEDTTGSTETKELGLEAWKIGAIAAAVFLVLETTVIIFYILKCRNKNGTPALQRVCEEGCVEPEEATGGDCNEDTLPADSGDTEQIAELGPHDAPSTLTHNKELHEEQEIAMSDLSSNSTEESSNTGPGPDSSQDLRTSIL